MHPYILLAKSAVENYINKGETIFPAEDLPGPALKEKAGVFITILKNGKLRGCLGTYLPTRPNIAQEIISNAIAAASKDYRFGRIEKEELVSLSYAVYILGQPEEIKSLEETDPKKFGMLVKASPFAYPGAEKNISFDGHTPFKSGLLLPGLAGINTAKEQFLLACQKGGINPEKEKVFIYRFAVEKFEE